MRNFGRAAGHRLTLWSGLGSTFDSHTLCQMSLLAEMFDFQMNTTLPLHCAEAAYRVKAIWNYDGWVKLWLIGLVVPVYTLFISLQLLCATSLYFPPLCPKHSETLPACSLPFLFYLLKLILQEQPHKSYVLLFFTSFCVQYALQEQPAW